MFPSQLMSLVRMGINLEDMLTILMNKSIMDHSRLKNFQKAKNADFNLEYSQKEMDQWSKDLLSDMNNKNFDLFEIVSKEDFLENNPDKFEHIMGFWNLVQTMSKEFNNAVVAMKRESNGSGRNIGEMIALRNRIERVRQDAVVGSFEKWNKYGLKKTEKGLGMELKFDPNIAKSEGIKVLGAMANNTLFFRLNAGFPLLYIK